MRQVTFAFCLAASIGILILLLTAAPGTLAISDDLPALQLGSQAQAGPLAKIGKGIAAVGRKVWPGKPRFVPAPQFVPSPQFLPLIPSPMFGANVVKQKAKIKTVDGQIVKQKTKTKEAAGRWESRRQCGPNGCQTVPVWIPAGEVAMVAPPLPLPVFEPPATADQPAMAVQFADDGQYPAARRGLFRRR